MPVCVHFDLASRHSKKKNSYKFDIKDKKKGVIMWFWSQYESLQGLAYFVSNFHKAPEMKIGQNIWDTVYAVPCVWWCCRECLNRGFIWRTGTCNKLCGGMDRISVFFMSSWISNSVFYLPVKLLGQTVHIAGFLLWPDIQYRYPLPIKYPVSSIPSYMARLETT